MRFKKREFEKALAAKGLSAHGLTSVCETAAYKAKNGKSISASTAKKIADELEVDVLTLIDFRR